MGGRGIALNEDTEIFEPTCRLVFFFGFAVADPAGSWSVMVGTPSPFRTLICPLLIACCLSRVTQIKHGRFDFSIIRTFSSLVSQGFERSLRVCHMSIY